jgi:hypothetical protein
MGELGEGLSGYLDVENATLRAPRLEATSNIGIANTAPRHAFSVGSNLYVSTDSSNVLTVNGNVACEGIKMGLIEITPSYDLAAVSNVGNVTSNTLQFSNAITGFVTTANAQIGRDLVVSGNTTVSTDLTVSANATVADTLTISEHLIASKEATVTGNLHVTTIRSDSNVVTEYTGPHDRPLRKYPEVALTSASQGGYVVTQSSGTAYDAFDEDTTSRWYSGSDRHYNSAGGAAITDPTNVNVAPRLDTNTDYGDWLAIEVPTGIKIESFKLMRYDGGFPSSGTLYAKNSSGDSWTEIYRYDGYTGPSTGAQQDWTHVFHVNSTIVYKNFALVGRVREAGQDDTAGLSIKDWELYGHEEGSGSLDTTLKTVYNVPATTGTQLEVYYDAKGLDNGNAPTNLVDLSPNTNNATLGGDPQVSNGAFVFDGTGDYITGTHGLSVPGQPVHSQCVWFKITGDTSDYQYISIIGTSNPTNQAGLVLLNDGTTLLGNYYGGERVITTITQNVWYHAVLVYTGTTTDAAKYYINGVEVITTGLSGAAPITPTITGTTVRLGANTSGGQELNGSIANFRLYSKALNADQVKELYDYQKDYFLGSKSQVTLYKGHLGVGVTEPSGQLELAGDERIQEYPPGPMDGYETLIPGHGVFCAYASTEHNTNRLAWMAFNDESGETSSGTSGFWRSEYLNSTDGPYNGSTGAYISNARLGSDTALGEYVVLQLPYKIQLRSLRMSPWYRTASDDFDIAEFPKNFTIYGSNDGNNWYSVFVSPSQTLTAASGSGATTETTSYTITNNEYYKYFGLVVTETNYGNYSAVGYATAIGNLQYFGTPGPTTLDKGSLTLGRSLDVPRVSRYDVDTETPRPEKLVLDFDTTVNSSPTDISGKGNHGTFNGNTVYSAPDKAFKFDGEDAGPADYIIGNLNNTGDTDFTVSLWLKKDRSGTAGLLWNFGGSGGSGNPEDSVAVQVTSGDRLDFFIFSGAKIEISNFGVDYLNKWVHIVATRTGIDLKIYLDGVDQNLSITGSEPTHTLQLAANTEYTIGARGTGSLGTDSLSGYISNFKVYDVVLEPSEVRKLYNLGRTGRSMVISDTAVGIGKVPEAQLDVRGIIKGQSPAIFSAKANATMTAATTPGTVAVFGSVITDTAGGWSSSNNRYYAKVPGFYWVYGSQFTIVAASTYVTISIRKNGVTHVFDSDYGGSGYARVSTGALMYLNVDDYVDTLIGGESSRTTGSGHRLDIVHVGM